MKKDEEAPATGDSDHAEIFVGNLPWSADEGKIREYFAFYGELKKVRVLEDD